MNDEEKTKDERRSPCLLVSLSPCLECRWSLVVGRWSPREIVGVELRRSPAASQRSKTMARIVAVTACPTGIAHTFMAAEALQKAAKVMGHNIKVETQGSVGAQNQLTPEEIAAADAVVIAADVQIDTSRFGGKRLYMTSTKHAMHNGQEVIRTALEQPVSAAGAAGGGSLAENVERAK